MSFRSPGQYWQGEDALRTLGARTAHLGTRALVVLTQRSMDELGAQLAQIHTADSPEFVTVQSSCTFATIEQVLGRAREYMPDFIVAVGGGSVIDTAKAAAHRAGLPVVVIPTIAATDAPTAAAAVIYNDAGGVTSIEVYDEGPALVLVDTTVIRSAPKRYLVSGMGDALATGYEARACRAAGAETVAGGTGTLAALAIAERCLETVLAEGVIVAGLDLAARPNPSVDAIVEANILLSGLGFESGGLAGAHAVHNGLVSVGAGSRGLHGELVAYGTLVHLALLDETHEIDRVLAFNRLVGLPVSCTTLGIEADDRATLELLAARACDPGDSMVNMPMEVTTSMVVQAIRLVESMVR